jgi:hypothetical protein
MAEPVTLDTPVRSAPRPSLDPVRVTGAELGLLLSGWCSTATGIALRDGRYTPLALTLVLTGAGLVALAVGRPGRLLSRLPPVGPRALLTAGLTATAVLVALAALVWRPDYYGSGPALRLSKLAIAVAGLTAAASLLPRLRTARWPFWAALALAALACHAMVVAAPNPRIDVWFLLQESTRGLFAGENMYRQHWPGSTGLWAVYPYLPGTSLLLAPFRLLAGDVRHGEVVFLVVAAILLRRICPATAAPALLPLLVIVFPKVTYSAQQAWTEPLLVLGLVVLVWAVRGGRARVAVVAFALALASKQHLVLLLPLLAAWPAFGPRRTAAATGLAGLICLPWFLAGPQEMWHDAVSVNLGYRVLPHALDIPALAVRHGVTLGFGATLVAVGAAYALAVPLVRRCGAYGFCAGSALVVLALNVTNKQSFFNHYTLAMALIVLAVCCGLADRRPDQERGAAGHRLA